MKQKHTHKLKRHSYKNGEKIYFCTLPECDYKVNVRLSLGKKVLCNRCNKAFIMNELSIRMAKPHCNDCTKKKDTTSLVSEILTHPTASSIDDLKSRLRKTLGDSFEKSSEVDTNYNEDSDLL